MSRRSSRTAFLLWGHHEVNGARSMKAIVLMSGGIDSPVAAYVMASQDAEIIALHMDNTPFTKPSEKAKGIVQQLRKVTGQTIPLIIAPHGKFNLSVIDTTESSHIRCVLCKRFMMRTAEQLAQQENCNAIIMGDSLGQVASQTLRNMKVEQQAIDMQIVRPLIGLDKEEIIKIAKEIGTYELSIDEAYECGIVPDKPSTNASLEKILAAEEPMDIKNMIENTVRGIKKF